MDFKSRTADNSRKERLGAPVAEALSLGAFYFLRHQFGVTSARNYPYTGKAVGTMMDTRASIARSTNQS